MENDFYINVWGIPYVPEKDVAFALQFAKEMVKNEIFKEIRNKTNSKGDISIKWHFENSKMMIGEFTTSDGHNGSISCMKSITPYPVVKEY